jgi:DNA-binding CsgD family transcriptional regulator
VPRVSSASFVGREKEMAALRAAAAAAAAGQTQIVLIDGDAGIGKSRLVANVCAQARREDAVAAVGGCVPLGEGSVAFAPFIELLRQVREELGAERFAKLAAPGLVASMILPGQTGQQDPAGELRLLAKRGRLDLRAPEGTVTDAAEPLAALHLTQREAEVLRLLAVGRTNREIGRNLFISEKTASVHVSNLMRKLGVVNRYEAAVIAGQIGLSPDG